MDNTTKTKLTEENISDLKYFWEYKEDLERLSSFKELIPLLERERPEILKAWNDYKASKKTLDFVLGVEK